MRTYDEIYSTLLKLCQKEGLRLVEAEFQNGNIQFMRFDDKIVINSNYHNRSQRK